MRKLYYRELVARFAYHPALIWNLGEENTNTTAQQKAFAEYIRALDPYDHPIVVHTFPQDHEKVYAPLLGYPNVEGPSLQLSKMEGGYAATLTWVERSASAGRPWVVMLDEPGNAAVGCSPDGSNNNHYECRTEALWANLMAGGGGVEWYFGYQRPHNDLDLEDFRSRDRLWDYTRFARQFFEEHLPFWEMEPIAAADAGAPADATCWYSRTGRAGSGPRCTFRQGRVRCARPKALTRSTGSIHATAARCSRRRLSDHGRPIGDARSSLCEWPGLGRAAGS